MAKPPVVCAKVRANYIKGVSLEQSAKLAKVAYTTASRWKKNAAAKGDCWDEARTASTASTFAGAGLESIAQQLLAELVSQLSATLGIVKNEPGLKAATRVDMLASLSDSMSKTTASMKRYLPEANALAVAMVAMKGMAKHVNDEFPHLAESFVDVFESYSRELPRIIKGAK